MYRLVGHLSYIDKYNKLKFVFVDDENETKAKLEQLCIDCTNKPFTDEDFTVVTKRITADIIAKIGLDITIYVKPRKYSFISDLVHNKGDLVTGYTLVLNKI